eukprot:1678570-Pyramimonas_sp.AAC.1
MAPGPAPAPLLTIQHGPKLVFTYPMLSKKRTVVWRRARGASSRPRASEMSSIRFPNRRTPGP